MDTKKSNKIREIVRLHQILKKWKKLAKDSKTNTNSTTSATTTTAAAAATTNKSIKFLKKTLSFSESSSMSNDVVPKGYLAVCVGKEHKRFVIPMEYLSHQAFGILLREAEEVFGFQQEGVLKIPCEVFVFEKILEMIKNKANNIIDINDNININNVFEFEINGCYSSSPELTPSQHAQMCR